MKDFEKGSMLMEDVLVNLLVAFPLLLLYHGQFYDFKSGSFIKSSDATYYKYDEATQSYIEVNNNQNTSIGEALIFHYQRLINSISLPIP